ncbi:MAG: DinB family protein [Acidobacteriota bacterium]|nr:DinB family protein [Acidobacteriota bacterium]
MKSSPTNAPDAALRSLQANALAERLEKGARALYELASELSDAEWQTRLPHDGRKIGVVVHHVGNMYPLEIQLAQKIAAGEPIEGVTSATVDGINAAHAKEHDGVTKTEALNFLRRNSEAAAAAIRALSDEDLAQSATNSLYGDAPLTCQFFLEDHAVRHSYHHQAKIRAALKS